ncbi:group II truncated hemoglobin [Acidocella sp.]|uniref:group II truncated hemoglobin n=1 Tax=Acidocella sp. TaxID=50710 RepID=UPI00260E72CD|nr:group II truncated hemoglobin [Acidocella sp.]
MSEAESGTIYDRLGGAAFTRALADRFYDIMESDPAYAGLRAMHEPDLGPVRDSFAGFLATWLGGPRDWLAARGGGFCVMSRHAGMGITAETAGQWVAAMRAAMAELVTDARLRAKIDEAFTRLAAAMARGGGENA